MTVTEPIAIVTPQLVPLGRMSVELRPPFMLNGTPTGGRWIFEVASGRLEGDRINATLKGHANADWLMVGPDGTGTMDVRSLMETDDGALVFVHYYGRVDLSAGPAGTLYSAPQFETGDDRYRWLNRIQAVGKGRANGTNLAYEIFEVR